MNPQSTTPTTAGRAVDAEVAIKIMGYHRFKELCIITTWNSPDKKLIDEKDVPHYSTDISAAMEVVDKLNASSIQFVRTRNDDWACFITLPVTGASERFYAEAATRPMALCLAALKAVGGRGE